MELLIWVAFAALAFGFEKFLKRYAEREAEDSSTSPIPRGRRGHYGSRDDEYYSEFPRDADIVQIEYEDIPEYSRPVPERYKYVEPVSLEDTLSSVETEVTKAEAERTEWSSVAPPLQAASSSLKTSRRKSLSRLNSANIRDAIVLTEILGKPKGAV